jgi:hypothetical protein
MILRKTYSKLKREYYVWYGGRECLGSPLLPCQKPREITKFSGTTTAVVEAQEIKCTYTLVL